MTTEQNQAILTNKQVLDILHNKDNKRNTYVTKNNVSIESIQYTDTWHYHVQVNADNNPALFMYAHKLISVSLYTLRLYYNDMYVGAIYLD